MSAGAFTNAVYQANTFSTSTNLAIRVQPETLALSWTDPDDAQVIITNNSIDGTVSLPIRATVSRNKRRVGVHARYVYIKADNPAPTGYIAGSVIKLPIMAENDWNAIRPGFTKCTYLGTTWTFIGREPERIV